MNDKKPDSNGTMDGSRAVTLINAMIDRMIDDEGGHARRVIDTLLDLGFTAAKLTGIFLFSKGDVEQAELDAKLKLRLLLFEECRRNCPGCCNWDWDLKALPACRDYTPYRLIMLTRGEPMLHPEVIRSDVAAIRAQTDAPIYLYTNGAGPGRSAAYPRRSPKRPLPGAGHSCWPEEMPSEAEYAEAEVTGWIMRVQIAVAICTPFLD